MVKTSIGALQVHDTLRKHLLVDGFDFVLDLDKSQGAYLVDGRTGTRYLDFFTFFASNPVGMNHPKMAQDDAFLKRMARIAIHNPSNSDVYTSEMAEFVETFSRVGIPAHLPHAFFVAGGALAVENALKVAFDWKVQKNFKKGYREEKGHMILHFEQAFHGRSGYTMSLTNTDPNKVALFPKFNWPRISNPKMTFPQTAEAIADVETRERLALAQAEHFFDRNRDDIAAIIVEPIQGEGGDNHFRPEFHRALRELADRHEALLIYDEVQTGVGLTGKFWCHEHYVNPDVIAFGKKAQVCGVLAGPRVDEVETNVFRKSSRINSTWGSNLVDMVRFQRYLEIIEEDRLVENSAKTGAYLLKQLENMQSEFGDVLSNARGKGLMCAFDMPNPVFRNAFIQSCYDNNMLILPCGQQSVRFRPNLAVTPEIIDEGLHIIRKSVVKTLESHPIIKRAAVKGDEDLPTE
jgi:L-lysine 6-transaminase